MKKTITIWGLVIGLVTNAIAQNKLVKDEFSFKPVSVNGSIEWDKFPEFTPPPFFKVVYQGPRFKDDTDQKPLKHGFSHLASYHFPFDANVPFKNRAGFSAGIPRTPARNFPWGSECVSPWNNNARQIAEDLIAYTGYCDPFNECNIETRAPVELFVHDFEANATNDAWIRSLKTLPCMPEPYRSLPDAEFVKQYKIAHVKLHAEVMRITKELVVKSNSKISLYGESPVHTLFYGIPESSWEDYTKPSASNYMWMDTTTMAFRNNGPVGKNIDFVTPWVYYFHNYDENGIKGQKGFWSYMYLPYLLFMVEVQQQWTGKDIIPYVQMRVQDPITGFPEKNINPEMAECTAIFGLLSGAKGIWLWDQINLPIDKDPNNFRNFEAYEHFIAGLYRISRHKHMFDGPFTYYRPKNPRDLAAVRQPVVRGVVNGSRILIAAHHPDANPEDINTVEVSYEGWKDTITLKGREVYLGEACWKCDLQTKALCPPATATKVTKAK